MDRRPRCYRVADGHKVQRQLIIQCKSVSLTESVPLPEQERSVYEPWVDVLDTQPQIIGKVPCENVPRPSNYSTYINMTIIHTIE